MDDLKSALAWAERLQTEHWGEEPYMRHLNTLIKAALRPAQPVGIPREVVEKIEAAKVGLAVLNALDETETAISSIRLLNDALALLSPHAGKDGG